MKILETHCFQSKHQDEINEVFLNALLKLKQKGKKLGFSENIVRSGGI